MFLHYTLNTKFNKSEMKDTKHGQESSDIDIIELGSNIVNDTEPIA